MTSNSGVNLRFQAKLSTPVKDLQRAIKRTRNAAKAIVGQRILSIQTKRKADKTTIGKPPHGLPVDERCCRRRHRHPQPLLARSRDDVENIRAFGWIAAGQDKQRVRRAECCDALYKLLRFLERKLSGASLGIRYGTAMHASKIAGASGLPNHGERALIKVHCGRRQHDTCHVSDARRYMANSEVRRFRMAAGCYDRE